MYVLCGKSLTVHQLGSRCPLYRSEAVVKNVCVCWGGVELNMDVKWKDFRSEDCNTL